MVYTKILQKVKVLMCQSKDLYIFKVEHPPWHEWLQISLLNLYPVWTPQGRPARYRCPDGSLVCQGSRVDQKVGDSDSEPGDCCP